jgi:predicted nucleic acid-binding protein
MNGVKADGLFFLDTNILAYTFDVSAPEKRQCAMTWVKYALDTGRGIIGTQVVQDFIQLAQRKFTVPLTPPHLRMYLKAVLFPLCQHSPSTATYERALDIQKKTGFAWYDALIVTAATETSCKWLISEDMSDGREIGHLTIRNPFK